MRAVTLDKCCIDHNACWELDNYEPYNYEHHFSTMFIVIWFIVIEFSARIMIYAAFIERYCAHCAGDILQ